MVLPNGWHSCGGPAPHGITWLLHGAPILPELSWVSQIHEVTHRCYLSLWDTRVLAWIIWESHNLCPQPLHAFPGRSAFLGSELLLGSGAWGSLLAVAAMASRSHPFPVQLALPLAGLTIKQQFCLLRRDVSYLQPRCAACSCSCVIVSEQSVVSKLLNPLPGLCCSQLLQIPTQWRLC